MTMREFKIGDLVTRDGTDIQRVIEAKADVGYNCIVVVCIKAPESGWCEVGEQELNLAGRYQFASPALLSSLPQ